MVKRTEKQILVQAVYAVACVAHHYGPGFSEEGLTLVAESLKGFRLFTDASYQTDVYEDDPHVDFSSLITIPLGWDRDYFTNLYSEVETIVDKILP